MELKFVTVKKWVTPTRLLPNNVEERMSPLTPRFTDKKGRVILPARFANSAVLIEELSETELRIRKAVILPEDEVPFTEERRSPLSDKDRDFLLSLLAAPPKPNAAFKRAAREQRRRHG
jgi:hypothetical protein